MSSRIIAQLEVYDRHEDRPRINQQINQVINMPVGPAGPAPPGGPLPPAVLQVLVHTYRTLPEHLNIETSLSISFFSLSLSLSHQYLYISIYPHSSYLSNYQFIFQIWVYQFIYLFKQSIYSSSCLQVCQSVRLCISRITFPSFLHFSSQSLEIEAAR